MSSSNEEKVLSSAHFSSSEEDARLPEYAQNALSDVNLPLLVLISSGHSPPLNPAPQLRFDVRSLPNPPKHIRDAYTGTSKRLQEWLRQDSQFLARRDTIRSEIEAVMTAALDKHKKQHVLKLPSEDEVEVDQSKNRSSDENEDEDGAEEATDDDDESATNDSDDELLSSSGDQVILRAGISCAMGRHRSVAMVEELARMTWPGWEVKVLHRDVLKKRGGRRDASKRSGRAGNRGGGGSSHVEEDW
jgi:hypothetical protein